MTDAATKNSARIPKKISWDFTNKINLLEYKNVHTVCEESRCPNRHECSALGIATFLIGGRECTRACKFCHIATAKPVPLSTIVEKEYEDIMRTAIDGKYQYLVITSVARDDDEAGLAAHFAQITRALAKHGITVELLIPDFHGRSEHLQVIAEAGPAVIAHNMETIERLSPTIRPQADYQRSLNLFRLFQIKYPHIIRKSGFMVGLGETNAEIDILLDDMKSANIDIISAGQYLQPSPEQATVIKNYGTDEFTTLEAKIQQRGFLAWEVGAFVRSSYMAHDTLAKLTIERDRRNQLRERR